MRKITKSNEILMNILYETQADPFLPSSIQDYIASLELISDYVGCHDLPDDFTAFTYLICNIDLFHEGVDPWGHYLNNGNAEGRQY